jgi:hypothetical protein
MKKPPSKKEIAATFKIMNQATEVSGNLYVAYESLGSDSKKSDKTYNKKGRSKKIKSQPKNIRMVKKYNFANAFIDFVNHIGVYREQRRKIVRERSQKRLFDYEKKKESDKDLEDQAKMHRLGFVRCEKYCKHYTHPTRMLESICECALKKANLSKKYTAEEIAELQMLILNKCNRTARFESDFVKFKHVFMYIELRCLECGNVHGDDDEGAHIYDPSTICRLQKAQIDLIYERDMHIIEWEHDITS